MKKLGKKGFTLIELLAVIVVLAVIMVIATQQINKTIRRARANSMLSSLNMAAKGAKAKIVDGSMDACTGSASKKCLEDVIDYDNAKEYTISVTASGSDWTITLTAVANGEFSNADFTEIKGYSAGYIDKVKVNQAKKDASNLPQIQCTIDGETGVMK